MPDNKNRRPERNLLGATTQERLSEHNTWPNGTWVLRSTVLVTFVLLAVQWLVFAVLVEVLA